jgi:hypothetical protein
LHVKALAAGAAAALTLAGAAAAATQRAPAHIRVDVPARHHVSGGMIGAAVSYLGVDRATIVAGLKAGQSLAQIATAHGKTADGLVAALLSPAKLKLDAAVTAGKLAADRETAILSRLRTALTALVNKAFPAKTPKAHRVSLNPAVILRAAIAYLGVDLRTIVQDLRQGKTLADVAVARGKTAGGLTSAIVAAAKTTLDAQVTAGRITQQQETEFLAQLQANATALVTGSHP